jgi:hypothetical protein
MSQAEQHELPSEEGGGRLNWLLAVLVLIVAVVMGIVLAAGVQSSGSQVSRVLPLTQEMPARLPTRARSPISSRTAGRFQTPHPLFRSRHYQRSSRSS